MRSKKCTQRVFKTKAMVPAEVKQAIQAMTGWTSKKKARLYSLQTPQDSIQVGCHPLGNAFQSG